jgi:hypothetical protein
VRAGDDRDDQEETLATACDTGALEQRRQRCGEPHEPARKRNGAQSARRLRHLAFLQAAVEARVRPVALADDDDAVRTRHAAEARRIGRSASSSWRRTAARSTQP